MNILYICIYIYISKSFFLQQDSMGEEEDNFDEQLDNVLWENNVS